MEIVEQRYKEYLLAIVFMIGIIYVVYIPRQQDFYELLIPISISFSIYFHLLNRKAINTRFWIFVAFLLKVILVFSFPHFSDDIYRFAWDGNLIKSGHSPYASLPSDIVNNSIYKVDHRLFEQMNSPDYYSVYPPINQFFFWISSLLAGSNIYLYAFITKMLLLIADIGSAIGLIKILAYFKMDKSKVLIYILNPLLLIELNGNLHFEGVMICFFIWALVFLYQHKYLLASLMIALSIGTKLVPILFLPIFLKYLWKNPQRNKFLVSLFIFGLVMIIPLIYGVQWQNFAKSLDLYFQKFEFNASIYYLIRWIGKLISGYNLIHFIGPALGLISMIVVFYLSWTKKVLTIIDIAKYALIALSVYYFNTTTVHPWYMSFLVMLSVFVPYKYALVWSAMIVLSYSHYLGGGYQEKYLFITIEYIVVAYFIWKDIVSISRKRI